jgi:hypothetical protein
MSTATKARKVKLIVEQQQSAVTDVEGWLQQRASAAAPVVEAAYVPRHRADGPAR